MTNLVKNFLQKLRNRQSYRSTFNELSQLNDRELNDIGIGRGDIKRVAMGDPEYKLVKDYGPNDNLKGWV